MVWTHGPQLEVPWSSQIPTCWIRFLLSGKSKKTSAPRRGVVPHRFACRNASAIVGVYADSDGSLIPALRAHHTTKSAHHASHGRPSSRENFWQFEPAGLSVMPS